LRVSLRHIASVAPIVINNQPLVCEKELNYLDLKFLSAKKFTVNLQNAKQKYFKALNEIFSKVGLRTSPLVLVSAIESYCVSVLLYASESLLWTRSMISSYEHAYSAAFMKIFKTFDKKLVEQCQFYMGQLPIEYKIVFKQLKFLSQISNSNNSLFSCLFRSDDQSISLCKRYNFVAPVDIICLNDNYWKCSL